MSKFNPSYFKERLGIIKDYDYRFKYKGYNFFMRYEYTKSDVSDSGDLTNDYEIHEIRIGWDKPDKKRKLIPEPNDTVFEEIGYQFYLQANALVGRDLSIKINNLSTIGKPVALKSLDHRVYPEDFKNLTDYLYRNPDMVYQIIVANEKTLTDLFNGLVIRFLDDRFDYHYEIIDK